MTNLCNHRNTHAAKLSGLIVHTLCLSLCSLEHYTFHFAAYRASERRSSSLEWRRQCTVHPRLCWGFCRQKVSLMLRSLQGPKLHSSRWSCRKSALNIRHKKMKIPELFTLCDFPSLYTTNGVVTCHVLEIYIETQDFTRASADEKLFSEKLIEFQCSVSHKAIIWLQKTWVHECFEGAFCSFWTLTASIHRLSLCGREQHHSKTSSLASEEESKSYHFETTWGWVNNDKNFHIWVTYCLHNGSKLLIMYWFS